MIITIFIIISTTLLILGYLENKTIINLNSLFIFPYIIIIIINNWIFYKNGFYIISDKTILMITISMIAFFIGTILIKTKRIEILDNLNITNLNGFNIKKINIILYIIGFLGLFKNILALKSGIFNAENFNNSEGYISSGIIGHLLLISYILSPYVFLYWLYTKDKKYLYSVILIAICAFSSFIKFHVISFIIIIYLFSSLYKKNIFLKGGLFFSLCIITLFLLNYLVSNIINDMEVDNNFYLNHFWKYFAGSIIHDNYIFDGTEYLGDNVFYKIISYLFTLPNMFLYLIGIKIFPHEGPKLVSLSSIYEEGNVVDVYGSLYPTNGSFIDILVYFVMIIIIGAISKYIYINRLKNCKYKLDVFVITYLTFFCFLNFFAPYATLTTTWEILVWSLIIPPLFYNNKRKYIIS